MQRVPDFCFGRVNLILRTGRPVHVHWGHDSNAEGWSRRSYRGLSGSCKAILLAIFAHEIL